MKISVALATRNEEKNIGACLESVKDLADEIVIADESSTDRTVAIAQKYSTKIIRTNHEQIFHITKQKALTACQGEWILQLDADEIVTPELAEEIAKIVNCADEEISHYQKQLSQRRLFLRHQQLLEKRDGSIGQSEGDYAGFFIPRLNYFLGKYLKHGGVYPDGVIRLVKRGKAYFPCQSVHEQIVVEGKVGWLSNSLIHTADKSFKRYLERNSYYIGLMVTEMKDKKMGKNGIEAIKYFWLKPAYWFFGTLFRHKGILDGFQGIIFSFFSALRFPRAYWRYIRHK